MQQCLVLVVVPVVVVLVMAIPTLLQDISVAAQISANVRELLIHDTLLQQDLQDWNLKFAVLVHFVCKRLQAGLLGVSEEDAVDDLLVRWGLHLEEAGGEVKGEAK